MALEEVATVGIRRTARKPDPTSTPDRRATLPDGFVFADMVVEVDAEKLAQTLADKALSSKKRSSRLCGGAIVVRATNIRRMRP